MKHKRVALIATAIVAAGLPVALVGGVASAHHSNVDIETGCQRPDGSYDVTVEVTFPVEGWSAGLTSNITINDPFAAGATGLAPGESVTGAGTWSIFNARGSVTGTSSWSNGVGPQGFSGPIPGPTGVCEVTTTTSTTIPLTYDLEAVCTSVNAETGQGSAWVTNNANQGVTVGGVYIAAGESIDVAATGNPAVLDVVWDDGEVGELVVDGDCTYTPPPTTAPPETTVPPTTPTTVPPTVPSTTAPGVTTTVVSPNVPTTVPPATVPPATIPPETPVDIDCDDLWALYGDQWVYDAAAADGVFGVVEAWFESLPGDPSGLDADGDGKACERDFTIPPPTFELPATR